MTLPRGSRRGARSAAPVLPAVFSRVPPLLVMLLAALTTAIPARDGFAQDAVAQDILDQILQEDSGGFFDAPADQRPPQPPEALREAVLSAPGAVLRGLDKVSGTITDLDMAVGETRMFGRLSVMMSDCRFPADNAAAEAYAHLSITDTADGALVFDGWMIASTPALNALDDARYDVWVLRCTTP